MPVQNVVSIHVEIFHKRKLWQFAAGDLLVAPYKRLCLCQLETWNRSKINTSWLYSIGFNKGISNSDNASQFWGYEKLSVKVCGCLHGFFKDEICSLASYMAVARDLFPCDDIIFLLSMVLWNLPSCTEEWGNVALLWNFAEIPSCSFMQDTFCLKKTKLKIYIKYIYSSSASLHCSHNDCNALLNLE